MFETIASVPRSPSFGARPDRTEITPEMQIGAIVVLGLSALMAFGMAGLGGRKSGRKRGYRR